MRVLLSIFAAVAALAVAPAYAQDIHDLIDFEQNMSAQAERFRTDDIRHVQVVREATAESVAPEAVDATQTAEASDRDENSHDETEGRKWGDSDSRGGAPPQR